MTIVWDWTDDAMELIGNDPLVCSLTGEPAKPPFLYWMDGRVMIINADAFVDGSPHAKGLGLMLDLAQLIHIASHLHRGIKLGDIRARAIRRVKGGEI